MVCQKLATYLAAHGSREMRWDVLSKKYKHARHKSHTRHISLFFQDWEATHQSTVSSLSLSLIFLRCSEKQGLSHRSPVQSILAREFFALPPEEKLRFDMSGVKKGSPHQRRVCLRLSLDLMGINLWYLFCIDCSSRFFFEVNFYFRASIYNLWYHFFRLDSLFYMFLMLIVVVEINRD